MMFLATDILQIYRRTNANVENHFDSAAEIERQRPKFEMKYLISSACNITDWSLSMFSMAWCHLYGMGSTAHTGPDREPANDYGVTGDLPDGSIITICVLYHLADGS